MTKQKFTTEYDENYAKFTLKYVFPNIYFNFICKDKPDLQNEIDKIGIEVARATSTNESIYNAFINYVHGKNFTIDEKQRIAIKMYNVKNVDELQCEIFNFGRSPSNGLITPKAFLKNVSDRNKLKNSKIQNYNKQNWEKLGLYLFASMPFEEYEIKSIIPELVSNSDFDFYIINATKDLYYIRKDKSYKKYIISDVDLKNFKQASLSINN